MAVDHLLNAGIDDHFGADEAGTEGRVKRGTLNRHPVVGSLGDGVLLAMGAEAFVQVLPGDSETEAARTAPFITIPNATGSPVVAGRDDAPVFDNNRGHFTFDAVTTERHHPGYLQEIVIPAGTALFF